MASKREGTLWIDREKLLNILKKASPATEIVGNYSTGQGPLAVFIQTRKEDGKFRRTEKGEHVLVVKNPKDEGGEVVLTIFINFETFGKINKGELKHTTPVGYAFRPEEEGNGRTLFAMTKKEGDKYVPVLSNREGKSRKYGFNLRARSANETDELGL